MRGVREDWSLLATAFVLPLVLASVFPFGAVRFRPRRAVPASRASAAFVALSETGLAAALRSAKTSWQGDGDGVRNVRADLTVGELPEDASLMTIEVGARPPLGVPVVLDYPLAAPPTTLAAPAPACLLRASEKRERPLPFARSELLEMK